ncbi:zonular occludens toxin domain-containing protein [Pseudoalteromonas arctica]|uniref:zonular occludens toxin domain-containing protein n=1 Tax=Pseudoalteromonas arctica TaxID=394751 RepID=UPI001C9CA54C|nr:zonular occludens toxin domain-containing protein [Pseudoalteromonas arctica]MBZ2191658.1 zonular occludens toxin domain-containing protein [Pseudoalteromonas arctica]MBZ2191665.1 zonular occludens toxin domain-containing protein [Pseudoalteromonas arctica]
MIYLRTGVPGAGKTLNSLKEICNDSAVTQKAKFYNNIKAFLLDLDFCNSFQGFFYGYYYPTVQGTVKAGRYSKIIKDVHAQNRMIEIADVPWLAPKYKLYNEQSAIELFVSWCRKCYPKSNLKPLDIFLEESESPTIESIKLLNYHWTHTNDPTDWPNLPNGSIALFDECQDYFPPMANSAKRPFHYTQFQKHRHSGVDIHLVTQHYTFLDNVIQKCTGMHVHYFRPMGGAVITRFSRDKQFSTDYSGDLEKCATTTIKRDSNFYGVYWSADDHTAKFKLPPKAMLFLLAIPMVIYLFYVLLTSLGIVGDDEKELKPESKPEVIDTAKPVKQTNKKDLLDLTYKPKKFEHPLNEICTDYEYGGYELKKKHGVVTVEHYINCVTGNEVEKQKTSLVAGDDDNQTERTEKIKEPEVVLLSSNYLEKLGYNIYLQDTLPILNYSGKNIFLKQF